MILTTVLFKVTRLKAHGPFFLYCNWLEWPWSRFVFWLFGGSSRWTRSSASNVGCRLTSLPKLAFYISRAFIRTWLGFLLNRLRRVRIVTFNFYGESSFFVLCLKVGGKIWAEPGDYWFSSLVAGSECPWPQTRRGYQVGAAVLSFDELAVVSVFYILGTSRHRYWRLGSYVASIIVVAKCRT